MSTDQGEVSVLFRRMSEGDSSAESLLLSVLYEEMRRIAERYMRRERQSHTLQPTALVHEAYLRLVEQKEKEWKGRAHFLAVAAQVMRHILIDHARARLTLQRGQGQRQVSLNDALSTGEYHPEEVLAIDEALQRLATLDARLGRLVELRFFGGLTEAEAAEALGVSRRTVDRDWKLAKSWLLAELSPHPPLPPGSA